MITVIAQMIINDGQLQAYLDFAVALKPMAEGIEGFISNERFQSPDNPYKILSLSFWKDEESINQFRKLEMHRLAEAKGRESIFKDYRVTIADVSRDYGMFNRKDAPVG
jgi:heme-degrading monooxygenase HmoA